jgi:hypothetical protein
MRGYRGYSRIWRRRPPGPGTLVAAALAVAALATACSAPSASPAAATFTPGAGAGTGASAAPSASSSGGTGTDDFVMPPFGSHFHVTMTDWLPAAGPSLVPAVVAAKNFWLAF